MPVEHGAPARRLRILVLHQHYWPEIAATAQILSDICEDLCALGHDVRVVAGQPSYRNEGASVLPRREIHRGVEIERVWSFVPRKRSIPLRLVQYGTYFGGSLASAVGASAPDVCMVMSTPPLLLGLTGTLLRALRGVPFVYSVQDLYPDVAVHLGVLAEGSLVARTAERASRFTYQSAERLVTLSSAMADALARKGVARDRVDVIPNWADTSHVRPEPRDNEFAREHGLAHGFVVQYSGNLGLSQGLDALLDAAHLLRELPIRFVVVGDGNAREALVARSRQLGLANVLFLPPQPRERLGSLLSSCDVGLVTMKRGVGSDLVPSKLYGILAAAKPVVASVEDSSEVARVLRRHDAGLTCAPESAAALAQCLQSAFELRGSALRAMGLRGRDACEAHYSRAASTRAYANTLARAAERGR